MTETLQERVGDRLRFGHFEFRPTERLLLRQGVPVALGGRAIDILAVLTEQPGAVIAKQELLTRVWPDAVVVDGALRVHMVALRRALDDGAADAKFITTVPGRGYAFVGALQASPVAAEGDAARSRTTPRALPARPTRVVGRDAFVDELGRQLELRRFVTVVGPGGIGKTTVALVAAHQWEDSHRGATLFVDLSELGPDSGDGVAEALCAKLGLAPLGVGPTENAIAHLRSRHALVVFDTCEGVIDAAARLAEALIASAPGVRVLATSRESLRAEGEFVHRIKPLAAPAAGGQLTAQEALTYPAVQLFVQRALASHAGLELTDAIAPVVATICRELDGMPLAIELAAGRVEAFGVQRVADLLATEFALTWPGRRTATPRQQTLRATLNWSYELLAASERKVLRRLSAVMGCFSLDAAIAACADADTPDCEVVEALVSLVAKSLLSAVTEGSRRRYRLLEVTRAYARSKLTASGEEDAVRQRQAHHYTEILNLAAADERDAADSDEQVANVRALLAWAFATEGMDGLAIELSAAAAPLWPREGLLTDSRRWTREALARLDRGAKVRSEIEARAALASSLMYTHGITAESYRNWEILYQKTRFEGRCDLRATGLTVLWGHQIRTANFTAAQRLVDGADFRQAMAEDGPATGHFHWMAATTAQYQGDHPTARAHAQRVLDGLTEASSHLVRRRFGYDLEVGALRLLSLSNFFLGDVDGALALGARAHQRAAALTYVAPLTNQLYWQAFIAYQLEETEEADRLTTCIIESGKTEAMQPAVGRAIALRGLSFVRRGDVAAGRELVDRGLRIGQEAQFLMVDTFTRAEFALQLARQGASGESEATLKFLEAPVEESWCSPELLRIKGELAQRSDDPETAETCYLQAVAIAERQGSHTWRLRAATSLARLWLAQGRVAEAHGMLAPVYEPFASRRQWPDLRRAADCLAACRDALPAN